MLLWATILLVLRSIFTDGCRSMTPIVTAYAKNFNQWLATTTHITQHFKIIIAKLVTYTTLYNYAVRSASTNETCGAFSFSASAEHGSAEELRRERHLGPSTCRLTHMPMPIVLEQMLSTVMPIPTDSPILVFVSCPWAPWLHCL